MPEPTAEALFEELLRQTEAGEPVDFEALCAKHPDLASTLRSLRAGHRLLDMALPPPITRGEPAVEDSPSGLWRRLLQAGPHGERYIIHNEIGRGGMGVVHQVTDPDLKRRLAMKVMHVPPGGGVPRGLSRFFEEAQVTGQLDHPGIVPVHELGVRRDGSPFYTMRQVRGLTLGEVFEHVRNGTEGWNQMRAVEVLLRVCDTMRYAHSKGVLHRDLKPSNVMVGRFGEVCVVDWGLARVQGRSEPPTPEATPEDSALHTERDGTDPESPLFTTDGVALGTAAYMAPEQAKGLLGQLGPHTDVYAVGAMLYHLLSGEMPYVPAGARLSRSALLGRVLDGPPKPLAAFGRVGPGELVAICDKAMARAIGQRYAEMEELAADLRAFVERRVVGAYQTGAWAETRQWVRRNRGLAVALLTVVVVVVAGAIALAWGMDAARRQRRTTTLLSALTGLEALHRLGNDEESVAHGTVGRSACDEWTAQASSLVRNLPELKEMLNTLRQAVGLVDIAGIQPPCGYARAEELAVKRAELLWRQRVQKEAVWPSEGETESELARYRRPATEKQWQARNREIFRMVRPDEERSYGKEQLALRLAEELVVSAHGTDWSPAFRDTLAFACYRVGDFERAVAEQEKAVADPTPIHADSRRSLQGNLKLLRELRESWSPGGPEREVTRSLASEVQELEEEIRVLALEGRQADVLQLGKVTEAVTRLSDVDRRLAAAVSASLDHRWLEASTSIEATPAYHHLRGITPQLDLMPLGPDPKSKLWEFAHLPSGKPAHRGPDGELEMHYDTGLVFVLLPGGSVLDDDLKDLAAGRELAPFFLSKYEMTCYQRARLDRRWMGALWMSRRELLSAAAGLSVADAAAVVGSAAGWLRLPTELEWHYAARAGEGAWWTRMSKEQLREHTFFRTRTGDWQPGMLQRNRFGLDSVIGNVAEWCEDRPSDVANEPWRRRVILGHGYNSSEINVIGDTMLRHLSSVRLLVGYDAGLRPARTLCR